MNRWQTLLQTLEHTSAAVMVTVASTRGSVPRGTDAWMIVTDKGFHGSIGGGTLEWKAMAEAQAMLTHHRVAHTADHILGPDLGQCCGGRVQLHFERCDHTSRAEVQNRSVEQLETQRQLFLFGAGHVGRAVVLALAPLPFDIMWIDPRPGAFPPVWPSNVTAVQPQNPVAALDAANESSLAFVMSHSHALDLEIVDAALRNQKFAYVGLIGSLTKRARFEKRLLEAGVDPARIAAMICPIGVGGIASKHPAAISASVAAQVLQLDSALQAASVQAGLLTGTQ